MISPPPRTLLFMPHHPPFYLITQTPSTFILTFYFFIFCYHLLIARPEHDLCRVGLCTVTARMNNYYCLASPSMNASGYVRTWVQSFDSQTDINVVVKFRCAVVLFGLKCVAEIKINIFILQSILHLFLVTAFFVVVEAHKYCVLSPG